MQRLASLRTPRSHAVAVSTVAVAATALLASTARAGEPVAYVLDGESTYLTGCFPPCMCPISMSMLTGTFTLVPEIEAPGFRQSALEDIAWQVGPAEGGFAVSGTGTYTIFEEVASSHWITLDLVVDGVPDQHFESGALLGGDAFPEIDIAASMFDMVCLDTAFVLSARPVDAPCPGDVDADGVVGFADLIAVLGAWGPCSSAECPEDLDGDGGVGFGDVLALLVNWGPCAG